MSSTPASEHGSLAIRKVKTAPLAATSEENFFFFENSIQKKQMLNQ
jgi:hypothetical protein